MINDVSRHRTTDCSVCYGPHDEEIHEATLRIHSWLQHEVTRKLDFGAEPAEAAVSEDAISQVA